MPSLTFYEIIHRVENKNNRIIYIVIIVLLTLGLIFSNELNLNPWILVVCAVGLMALLIIRSNIRLYFWLYQNDVDPARLMHSFVTRRYVIHQYLIDMSRFFSLGQIRSDLTHYREQILAMDRAQPFAENIDIDLEYHFDKSGFFSITSDFLSLNSEGIYYEDYEPIFWKDILHLQINNRSDSDSKNYNLEITNQDTRVRTINITSIETNFVELELILKAMHVKYQYSKI